eukprot:273110_1
MKYKNLEAFDTTYYLDFSDKQHEIKYNETPYTDVDINDRLIPDETLLIFTDGSVKDFIGGYGVWAIKEHHYKQIVAKQEKPEKWIHNWNYESQIKQTNQTVEIPIFMHKIEPISARTSIDFCEAIAIRDAIYDIAEYIQKQYRKDKTWGALSKTSNIKIISDSLTVINWLTGEYSSG